MPFLIASRKKRGRSNSRGIWSNAARTKLPKLFHHNYDGPASRNSIDSSNTALTRKSSVMARMSRGGSRVRSLFSIASRQSDAVSTPNEDDTGFVVATQGSFASFRPVQSSTATTVVNRPRLRLTGTPDILEPDFLGDLPAAVQRDLSAPSAEDSDRHTVLTNRRALRKSHSAPGLSHRLSHRISQAFGNPTIVHRSDLRSRPSVHEIPFIIGDATQLDDGSNRVESGPTSKGTSISSSIRKQPSTTPTSDGLTVSPTSGESLKIVPTRKRTFLIVPSQDLSPRKLSTISESTLNSIPSIATVEATAAAKIFFETHFNTILNRMQPRSVRRREFEARLCALNLPEHAQRKARKAWQNQQTEHLRQERALMTRSYSAKASKGVSISGYEIIKVLGKGSFGVVRLVKEKKTSPTNEETLARSVSTPAASRRPSMADLIALKESAKEVLAPLGSRKSRQPKGKKQVYAMKVIRKSEMVRNSQEGHLRAERDFLVSAEGSRWVVPLIAAFQDNHNLYLVMDYCIGGDFLGLLIRKNVLSEDITRWYIAEMILGVEEAHRMRWIHRDVKPDNFLIGDDGHLKISDFGLAFDGDWSHNQAYVHQHRQLLVDKLDIELQGDEQDREETELIAVSAKVGEIIEKSRPSRRIADKSMPTSNLEPPEGETILDWRNREHRRKLARSVVGTSQYMAPEVIRGDLYDGRCDWWSIGIILYECLYGFTPFACENRHDTKLHILKHKTTLEFPHSVRAAEAISYDALDLMMQILQEKERRLCSQKYSNNDFMRKMLGGSPTRSVPSDKSHQNYQGYFVYPNDAEDLKAHPFFNRIKWESMHLERPPFVPRVKSWEDTKYFDEDDPVSDMSVSSEDDDDNADEADQIVTNHTGENVPLKSGILKLVSKSGHRQEDQKIVPSKLDHPGIFEGKTVNEIVAQYEKSKLLPDPLVNNPTPAQVDGQVCFVKMPSEAPASATVPPEEIIVDAECVPDDETTKNKRRKKEKKRPRDKILRDAVTGKIAMRMRKQRAFLGYEYKKGKGVDDVLGREEPVSKLPGKKRSLAEMKAGGGAHQERLMELIGERSG